MEVAEGICQNISIGGMLVLTDNPRPQGSLVRFDLEIDNEANIRGLGEVVWMRSQAAGPGQESGMGIKFRFLEQRDRQVIFKLVSEHIKQRLSQKHPGTEAPALPSAAEAGALSPSSSSTIAPLPLPSSGDSDPGTVKTAPPDDLTTPQWQLDNEPTIALGPPEPSAPEPSAPEPAAPEPSAPEPSAPEPAAPEPAPPLWSASELPSASEPLPTAGGNLLSPLDDMTDSADAAFCERRFDDAARRTWQITRIS